MSRQTLPKLVRPLYLLANSRVTRGRRVVMGMAARNAAHGQDSRAPSFTNLTDGFGWQTYDVDISRPLNEAQWQHVSRAFFAGQLLVLRGQRLSPAWFHAFAKRFGPPEPHVIEQFHHPENADILILSNVQRDGNPIGLADAGTYFHTDYSYLDVPARATLLYSIEVPKKGGDTLFADQYTAYEELPASLKRTVENRVALHHYGNRDDQDRSSRTVASVLTEDQEKKMAWVRHRIARRHPVTGRVALYAVSGSSFGIEGLP